MIDDLHPDSTTAPAGALVPLPSQPSVALAGEISVPARQPVLVSGEAFVRELAHTALDALDSLGDSIATVAGLR